MTKWAAFFVLFLAGCQSPEQTSPPENSGGRLSVSRESSQEPLIHEDTPLVEVRIKTDCESGLLIKDADGKTIGRDDEEPRIGFLYMFEGTKAAVEVSCPKKPSQYLKLEPRGLMEIHYVKF